MRTFLSVLMVVPLAVSAETGAVAEPIVLADEDVVWGPGPESLPPGAEIAVLEGDPAAEGTFTIRLRLPADYRLDAHTHAGDERVTVLSGAFHLVVGEGVSDEGATTLGPGGFFVLPPGTTHHAWTTEETVLQITTEGPWGIEFAEETETP